MEKKKKLLRKVEKAKSNKDLSQGQTADDNISLQPAYPTDSESEESLSGDDRDDNPEISETAIQNIIIEDDPKPSSDIFQVEEQVGKDSSEEATHSTNLAQENTESINSQEVINSVMGDTTGIDIPVRQEIDEDKSLAALSTLRKLKSKKVALEFPQVFTFDRCKVKMNLLSYHKWKHHSKFLKVNSLLCLNLLTVNLSKSSLIEN